MIRVAVDAAFLDVVGSMELEPARTLHAHRVGVPRVALGGQASLSQGDGRAEPAEVLCDEVDMFHDALRVRVLRRGGQYVGGGDAGRGEADEAVEQRPDAHRLNGGDGHGGGGHLEGYVGIHGVLGEGPFSRDMHNIFAGQSEEFFGHPQVWRKIILDDLADSPRPFPNGFRWNLPLQF